jgi:predicted 3-demethylubiquinone-9 3-methyltransferase (glyoxalase superfamily)
MKVILLSLVPVFLVTLAPYGPGGAPSAASPRLQTTPIPQPTPPKITPCLWFASEAEDALRHYLDVFEGARLVSESRFGEGAPVPEGTLMSATFELAGARVMLLNGAPARAFTEAVSLQVSCDTQAEVDRLWEKLGAGGAPGRCGWLKDRFGVSWQVVPAVLGPMLADPDAARAGRVAEAMLQMDKLDIARLKAAYDRR